MTNNKKINLKTSTSHKLSVISYRLNTGFVMVEAIVALSVLTIGFLGISTILSSSLGLNQVLINKHIATSLAAEGVELTKNIIDTNYLNNRPWNTGLTADGNYEMDYDDNALSSTDSFIKFDSASGFYSYNSGLLTPFKRTINIRNIDPNKIEVTSTVTWKDRNNINFDVKIVDRFYNWRQGL